MPNIQRRGDPPQGRRAPPSPEGSALNVFAVAAGHTEDSAGVAVRQVEVRSANVGRRAIMLAIAAHRWRSAAAEARPEDAVRFRRVADVRSAQAAEDLNLSVSETAGDLLKLGGALLAVGAHAPPHSSFARHLRSAGTSVAAAVTALLIGDA